MKITIIGGGNIGILMASEMSKLASVYVYSSKYAAWNSHVDVFDNEDNYLFTSEKIVFVNNLKIAVENADVVFVTYPSYLFDSLSIQLSLYLLPGTYVGIIPGGGGSEFAFSNLVAKGCVLFGLQRVHSIARIKEYGKSVYMLGRKDSISVSSIPNNKIKNAKELSERLFNMKCTVLPNYLSITLTPSNPILHTTRLYSMFREWTPNVIYPNNILFYESWDDDSSRVLLLCDEEVQNLCNVIPLDLSYVKSLKEHYGVTDVQTMTEKIKSINAFKGILSPMKKVSNGFMPDFSSRYFMADFSFGIKVIKDIAGIFGVETPYINMVWKWYIETTEKCNIKPKYFETKNYTQNEFVSYYKDDCDCKFS